VIWYDVFTHAGPQRLHLNYTSNSACHSKADAPERALSSR
jgi:hypothetical protein